MEELNTQLTVQEDSESVGSNDPEDSLSSKLNQKVSRRSFLKGAGILGLGALLTACAPKSMLESAEKDMNTDANVKELNLQFQERINEFVDERGVFNYEKYSKIYPEFEQYRESIDLYSVEIRDFYGIHPGAMKALASSILVANVDRKSSESVFAEYQRVGLMGLVPKEVLPVVNESFGEQYSIAELEHPQNSIYFAMIYMAETLKNIQNDGDSKDLMTLMLANYYGGTHLQNIVKGRSSIEHNQGLKEDYDLFKKTLDILGRPPNYAEGSYTEFSVEMDDVWNRVINTWPASKFGENKEVFYQEVERYYSDQANRRLNLDKETYLAIFTAIAAVESHGGLYTENSRSGALGWYQLIPRWKHLEDYNQLHGTSYSYEDIVRKDDVSIKVGVWALMRYRDKMDMKQLMKMFKGGGEFGKNSDDYAWWNSVSRNIRTLLGDDVLAMGEY
jgi:hypothetical protein